MMRENAVCKKPARQIGHYYFRSASNNCSSQREIFYIFRLAGYHGLMRQAGRFLSPAPRARQPG